MSDHERDKQLERDRYEARAAAILTASQLENLELPGATGVPEDLRAPYSTYENHILRLSRPGIEVLDVCCGNGQHSLISAARGARVSVSDIAPQNVELTLRRAALAGWEFQGKVADAEHLPWPDASFDLITCAGSLSYVDHLVFSAKYPACFVQKIILSTLIRSTTIQSIALTDICIIAVGGAA